uniref:Uncharacterized protein n=1 Tax=Salix viminalis TaxID=40686 RepID=A0A6N2KXY8_SALVM
MQYRYEIDLQERRFSNKQFIWTCRSLFSYSKTSPCLCVFTSRFFADEEMSKGLLTSNRSLHLYINVVYQIRKKALRIVDSSQRWLRTKSSLSNGFSVLILYRDKISRAVRPIQIFTTEVLDFFRIGSEGEEKEAGCTDAYY